MEWLNVFRITVFLPTLFHPPGLRHIAQRSGPEREWDWPGLCSTMAVDWVSGPQSSSASPVPPVGSSQHPFSPTSFSPSCIDHPVLARLTWHGAGQVEQACPSPITSPALPSLCLVPSPLTAFAILCVTHLLFCLKLPTSFIIDSSLSSQVSPLHGSTNCPLL